MTQKSRHDKQLATLMAKLMPKVFGKNLQLSQGNPPAHAMDCDASKNGCCAWQRKKQVTRARFGSQNSRVARRRPLGANGHARIIMMERGVRVRPRRPNLPPISQTWQVETKKLARRLR